MTRKIILATVGTMGDLHPFIAIAHALRERGFRPVLAVPEDHLAKAEAAGIEAVAVLPSFATIFARMGVSDRKAAKRIINDQRQMFERVILPDLSSCAAALDAMADDAEAIVASAFFLAAPIVAQKRHLPLVSVVLQPMAMLSAFDPPHTPDFWMMKGAPVGPVGARWNRAMYAVARQVLDLLYGRRIDAARREHGLPPAGGARMFEAREDALLALGCYSPHFAALPPDAYPNTRLTGFPLFDSASGGGDALDSALAAFLNAGAPPLVFTLGTFAIHAAGRFYEEAAEIARRLGTRAVLLTGGPIPDGLDESIFACAYAPHSAIFPHASVIVHHGGVGTTGQALRAGKPQLVVPHMGDQNDHAIRIERLGLGHSIAPNRFKADRVAPVLRTMLGDGAMQAEARRIGAPVMAEHGATAAAAAIAQALDTVRIQAAPSL